MMRIPKYRKNPDGRAFVQVHKKRYYLGIHGSRESLKLYREFIAGIVAEPVPAKTTAKTGQTVAELLIPYIDFAKTYYKGSREFNNVRDAGLAFVEFRGEKLARLLDPLDLLAFQEALVEGEFARPTINAMVGRVKRWLKWCVTRQLLSAQVFGAIALVEGLREGRTEAREPPPIEAVPLDVVEKTLKHVAPVVAAMARVQYLCGMRPDEVCRMRQCDIDMTGDVWFYKPTSHKNTWRGKKLTKGIPKAAQKILAKWISTDPEAWIFSPAASVEWWSKQVPRKTKVFPYELRQRKKAAKRANAVQRRYTSASYGKAIMYGIDRANRAGAKLPHWTPNQLRHSISGELSRKLGQQAAQRWLGHARLDTTAIYDELHVKELAAIAKAVGEITQRAVGES